MNEGFSVAIGATLLDGTYCYGTKLGLMGGLEVIESGMRLGMGVGTGTACGFEAYTTTWVMV